MSDMATTKLADQANALLALHRPGDPVVLPTVWDAWSAALSVAAGFAALTVGSHPVADSVGKPDGEGMTFDDLLARVAQITGKVTDTPVSVDIESGYAEDPRRLIDGLLSVGAVGLNIEDTVHSEGKRLRSSEEHAALVGALRKAADDAGVHVVRCSRTGSGPVVRNAAVPDDAYDWLVVDDQNPQKARLLMGQHGQKPVVHYDYLYLD